MKNATATSVVSASGRRKYNKVPVFCAVFAVALTATGLGVGLSQHNSAATTVEQKAGFIFLSAQGAIADNSSFVSGGLSFPSTLPVKVQDSKKYAFFSYESDNLTPKPVYQILTTRNVDLQAGKVITDDTKSLARLRAGDVFTATYGVINTADRTKAFDFVVSYTVAVRKLTLTNQSLYDNVSFAFATKAEREAASLPLVDVQVEGDPADQFITPVYKDSSGNDITSADQVRALPSGSSFNGIYKASRTVDGKQREHSFVVTYVVADRY